MSISPGEAPLEYAFIKKLRHGAELTSEDEAILAGCLRHVQHVAADRDIVRDGDQPDDVRLVMEGVACRYKLLTNGNRSIMAVLIPGDFCDLQGAILGRMDHAICALTPCRIVRIPRSTIEEWTERRPRINRALWWSALVDEGILRAWLANVGARWGVERIAHLFCELRVRMQTVGLVTEDGYSLPLTQQHLGDTVGLSIVHVNRVLRQLRECGAVSFKNGRVKIDDLEQLSLIAGFDPGYLHLEGPVRQAGVVEAERVDAS